jgi:hypothetical protein
LRAVGSSLKPSCFCVLKLKPWTQVWGQQSSWFVLSGQIERTDEGKVTGASRCLKGQLICLRGIQFAFLSVTASVFDFIASIMLEQQSFQIWDTNDSEDRSRVSSGSIVSDYGLDDRAIGVRSPAEAENFSSSLCVQTGSEAHPASCTMGTGGPFPQG